MQDKKLNLDHFNFTVPEGLIAQNPLPERTKTQLLVYHQNKEIEHTQVCQFDQVIPENSLLLVNDTRVMPCRLKGRLSSQKKVELLLLGKPKTEQKKTLAYALARPGKSLKVNTEIFFAEDLKAKVLERKDMSHSCHFLLEFSLDEESFITWMDKNGFIPLPPYIQRQEAKTANYSKDTKLYQTAYANEHGSCAAPTAGLHFTKRNSCKTCSKKYSTCNCNTACWSWYFQSCTRSRNR